MASSILSPPTRTDLEYTTARQGNDRHFSGAAADVDHHVGGRLLNGQVGPDGGGHGLLDEVYLARARALGRLLDRALFHLGDAGGHADHDPGPHQAALVVDFGDEIAEHGLRHLKVGYDAVFHGANGLDVARRAAQHALGLGPYGENLIVAPRVFFYGHHGRFAEHNAVALDVNAESLAVPKSMARSLEKIPRIKSTSLAMR